MAVFVNRKVIVRRSPDSDTTSCCSSRTSTNWMGRADDRPGHGLVVAGMCDGNVPPVVAVPDVVTSGRTGRQAVFEFGPRQAGGC